MRSVGVLAWVVVAVLVVIAGLLAHAQLRHRPPSFTSEYQAVLVASGQVYYGRLESFGTAYPVLRDIYYVQVKVDPETKQSSNVLIPRGQEWQWAGPHVSQSRVNYPRRTRLPGFAGGQAHRGTAKEVTGA
jgi:hypothetical protein